jgi:hypothetical protein
LVCFFVIFPSGFLDLHLPCACFYKAIMQELD